MTSAAAQILNPNNYPLLASWKPCYVEDSDCSENATVNFRSLLTPLFRCDNAFVLRFRYQVEDSIGVIDRVSRSDSECVSLRWRISLASERLPSRRTRQSIGHRRDAFLVFDNNDSVRDGDVMKLLSEA